MREKVREILSRDRSSGSVRHYFARLGEDTNDTLSLLAEEVRKVEKENPYDRYRPKMGDAFYYERRGYCKACQAILELLEEQK